MSYFQRPSSSGGAGGVQNPMTETLDANGFSIVQVKDLSATRRIDGDMIIGSQLLAAPSVNAANELAMSNPTGTVGFYGVAPVFQQTVAFPIVGADPMVNEDTINQICTALQALGLIQ